MKFVINTCFGGFGLSEVARVFLNVEDDWDVERDDPMLVACIEALGEKAFGRFAELKVITIPEEATDWELDEYDGAESITYVLDGKIHHLY